MNAMSASARKTKNGERGRDLTRRVVSSRHRKGRPNRAAVLVGPYSPEQWRAGQEDENEKPEPDHDHDIPTPTTNRRADHSQGPSQLGCQEGDGDRGNEKQQQEDHRAGGNGEERCAAAQSEGLSRQTGEQGASSTKSRQQVGESVNVIMGRALASSWVQDPGRDGGHPI